MSRDERRGAEVGSVLRDVLKRIDPEKRLRAFEVWNFWGEVAGSVLARRAQPSGYRNGVLFVTVGAHAWMQDLQFMKETLRQRLNERLGSDLIRDITFVSGAVDEVPAQEEDVETDSGGDHSPQPSISLPAIDDPELAEVFRRLIQAHTRRKKRRDPRRE